MTDVRTEAELTVREAVTVVVAASAVGGAFGYLFTVHFLESVVEAVWVTTVLFAAVGLVVRGAFRS